MRPSWDEYFMRLAYLVSTRATCTRRKVGAVIVKDRRVLATGYNGPPKGLAHCDVTGCIREELNIPSGERHELCRGLHAEQNAIIQAAVHGVSIKDATIYVTNHPCVVCAKMIINAEIKEIVYSEGYPDDLAELILLESGIKVRQYKLDEKVIESIVGDFR
ncbi:MAG: cytidine/deoxycytidylate deaminase family protein [Thermoplasmata archaeon]|nr:cytidine/deoxycytidylate deaminase family protein [Thermoplasmata archaeon]